MGGGEQGEGGGRCDCKIWVLARFHLRCSPLQTADILTCLGDTEIRKNFPITAPREESSREKEADIAIKQLEQGQRWAKLVIAFNLTTVLKIHRVGTVSQKYRNQMPEGYHYFLSQAKKCSEVSFLVEKT